MTRRGQILAIWAVVALALILLAWLGPDNVPAEDDPGWDCHTMGNRICGSQPR